MSWTFLKRLRSDFDPKQNSYDRLFIYLLLANLILGFLWLDKPSGALIFDEKYYVNVARNLLRLPHDPDVYPEATPGLDPNREHPFLGKGIIAFSIMIFGDNAWGWRIPSVLFGSIALLAFYLLVKRLSRKADVALLASLLLVCSNLFFVHSRIATLDIFMLSFMLVGFYLYMTGRTLLSAFSMVLATLSKIGGLYGFVTIICFHFLNLHIESRKLGNRIEWRSALNWLQKYVAVYVVVGFILLTIFDRIWLNYSNPLDHIFFIYDYHKALTRAVPEGIESLPWQWLLNEVKIPYITVNVDASANGKFISSRPSIAFEGAINPFILFLTIPVIIYSSYIAYKNGDNTALFTVVWFSLTYLPFYPMSIIGHRIMYLFYFLSTLPSVCLGISYILLKRKTDRIIVLIYLFAVFLGAIMLFPFRQVP